MAARRCSNCSTNWPLHVGRCPRCGDTTWHLNEGDPDETAVQGEGDEYELWADAPHVYDPGRDGKIIAWRLRCLEDSGMGSLDATALALRRDVDIHRVVRLLKAGASSGQARRIVE